MASVIDEIATEKNAYDIGNVTGQGSQTYVDGKCVRHHQLSYYKCYT